MDISQPARNSEAGIVEQWREVLGHVVGARRRLLRFQLCYALVVGAALAAGVSWLLESLIARAGAAAVTNYDLAAFFLSVPGLCFLAVTIGAFAASYFMERC